MSPRRSVARARRQGGLGLAEVLVAMAIGLVLVGGISYLLMGSKWVSRTQDEVSRMQESGRNAMEALGKAIRQAGFVLDVDQPMAGDPMVGTDSAGALPDTLTISHDPAWVADATVPPNPVKGSELNCEGVQVTSNNTPDPITGVRPANTNTVNYAFSVAGGQLLCKADTSNPAVGGKVVADNIEDMQITYGIGNGAEIVQKYVTAPTATEWAHVNAVRISLLVRGPSAGLVPGNSQTYFYNGANVTSTDGHLRQVYTSTFTVRNQARWK